VHHLLAGQRVDGVTTLDDQLFLLLTDRIEVYRTTDHSLSHHIPLPGLNGHKWNDLTSCELHRCLYVSDCEGTCVRRVAMDGSESKWPVSDKPRGLWVTTGDRNLLVTCVGGRKLIQLNPAGEVVREISFQVDIELPWHAVSQLMSGSSSVQFVVCHGLAASSLHRVCLVNADGQILCSFGGNRGCDLDHLNIPCYMAIDNRSRSVIVADYCNRRVVQLDESLQFRRTIVDHLSGEPRRMHFNHVTRRLYVAIENTVCVVQL